MAYYDQGDPGAGKTSTGKTPGRLHDDRRWRSMVWGFFGLVIGLLLGAIGTAVMGDRGDRPIVTQTTPPPIPTADCTLTDDGAITATPCRLDAATLAAFMDVDGPTNLLGSRTQPSLPEPLPICERADDGAITGTPCRVLVSLPPLKASGTGSANTAAAVPPDCTVNADGSVTGARCVLTRNIAAPVAEPAPEPASLDPCRISIVNGTVTGAPCRLASNFTASRSSRTLGAEMTPRQPPLTDCRIDQAMQSITNAPCRLTAAFRPTLDASFGPVPKSALKVCPTRGFASPLDLGCGLRVRDSGYVSLSKIAEAYYGDTDAACLIFDRNKDVFGTRTSPIRRNDPHCILPEDILFMPATALDEDFGRCITPPRKANVCEAG
ncbi:MAG: hypothetical protein AAGJ32_00455 [Pseudomonadota bacterium]